MDQMEPVIENGFNESDFIDSPRKFYEIIIQDLSVGISRRGTADTENPDWDDICDVSIDSNFDKA